MSSEGRLAPGEVLSGKWKGGRYRIERLLGEGANGSVYLVGHAGGKYALKIGNDAAELQSEINVLTSLALRSKSKGRQAGGDFLVAVDDYTDARGRDRAFYVMRYVRGVPLAAYIEREGAQWLPLIGLHLLRKLALLHESGWVFGDLKLANVLVEEYGHAQLVDYGGVTAIGKGVRQFTEIYDRGYWSAGTRAADPGYDLFAMAILLIQLVEGRKLDSLSSALPQNRTPSALLQLAEHHPALVPFREWLRKAILGRFRSTREAIADWQRLSHQARLAGGGQRKPQWVWRLFLASAALLAGTLVWYAQA